MKIDHDQLGFNVETERLFNTKSFFLFIQLSPLMHYAKKV